MNNEDRLVLLQRDSTRVSALASNNGASAQMVEHCPAWSLTELVEHLGQCHRFTTACLPCEAGESVPFPEPRERASDLADWFASASDDLIAALGQHDDHKVVPSFRGDVTVDWWIRRITLETAVHRWDVENAIGEPHPIDAALAADGIAELLDMRAGSWTAPTKEFDHTIHLHGTDGDGEFLVSASSAGLTYQRAHAKGDVAARGSLSDLYLTMWKRKTPNTLDVFGDVDVLEGFLTGF